MWNLDDFRIRNLAKFRIVQLGDKTNPLTFLHDQAAEEIQQALAAYQKKDYELFDAYSRQAWANEARVYPQAQQTANDVVQGVIFYLFLLIPFAYFLERLLFGYLGPQAPARRGVRHLPGDLHRSSRRSTRRSPSARSTR